MKKKILGTDVVMQIAIVVHDIEKTAQAYADFLGVAKPEVIVSEPLEQSHTRYRGNPTPARARFAFFTVGPSLQIELIQPDAAPSTWREELDQKGEGVHHIAFQIRGMREKIADLGREGMPLLQSGEYTGGRYAYIDSNRDLKVFVELLEND